MQFGTEGASKSYKEGYDAGYSVGYGEGYWKGFDVANSIKTGESVELAVESISTSAESGSTDIEEN
jgi:hypothetical protein